MSRGVIVRSPGHLRRMLSQYTCFTSAAYCVGRIAAQITEIKHFKTRTNIQQIQSKEIQSKSVRENRLLKCDNI